MAKGKQRAHLMATILLACCLITSQTQSQARAQDLLRQRQHQPPQQQQQQQQLQQNSLANIQLPPQLASLTPQQLYQLAQLRELQLQQQASQQQQQDSSSSQAAAPAPIGAEVQPTAAPAAPGSGAETNERHDDGSYNESGSEMEGVAQPEGQASGSAAASSSSSAAAAAPTFEVNWNKCPQLEPSESEKGKKTQVITKCLQSAPIPANLTRENVETHREQIATCALKVEGWFDEQGNYNYEKAETEIRGKKLEPAIEVQVLKFHVACKEEASKKFPRDLNKLIDQVQFYQACMDYYISIVCEIEVSVDQ